MNIHIEYCIKWNYSPEFDRVSNIIKQIFPDTNIDGNKKYPRSGAFEVSINGTLVYSKFKTGQFPNEKQIKNWFN